MADSNRPRHARWVGLGALPLLAGVALLLIVQPFDGDDSRASRADASPLEQKALAIEEGLADNPDDAKLLLATMQAWFEAGANWINRTDTATEPIPDAAKANLKAALSAWNRFLRQTHGEVKAEIAERAGLAYFYLMEIGSRDLDEIEANAAGAARAFRIAGRHLPVFYTLSGVAIHEYFAGEFGAGDKAARAAIADLPKANAKPAEEQLGEYRERAVVFRRQLRQAAAELRRTGEDQLEKPLKAYTSPLGINQDDPAS